MEPLDNEEAFIRYMQGLVNKRDQGKIKPKKELTDKQIAQEGLRFIKEIEQFYGVTFDTPYEVNCGYCDVWANKFQHQIGGHVQDTESEGIFDDDEHYHEWIEFNGKYYDAECLYGVTDLKDLPYFQRNPMDT